MVNNTGLPGDEYTEKSYEEDFSDVKDMYPTISAGKHYAQIIDFFKDVAKSGNDMFVWQYKVVGKKDEDAGKEQRDWTSLVPQARWRVAKHLDAIGVDATGKVAKFTAKDVIGKLCIIEVTLEDEKNSITEVYPIPAEALVELHKEMESEETPF